MWFFSALHQTEQHRNFPAFSKQRKIVSSNQHEKDPLDDVELPECTPEADEHFGQKILIRVSFQRPDR